MRTLMQKLNLSTRAKKLVLAPLAIALLTVAVSAESCDYEDKPTATQKEDKTRTKAQEDLVAKQPAHTGDFSPTRATKNFWIDTWMQEKGKVSYVYILNADGEVSDYGVFEGLPVSYCVGLIPPYTWVDIPGDEDDMKQQAPAPSIDGTFSSGGDCNTKYGKDATTGAYVEFSVALGQSYRAYDQPLPANRLTGATPLGPTK